MLPERMIKTQGLTKRFKGTADKRSPNGPAEILAVDHVDLEVREGEVFAFLGPNGAGKTTTVRMLACLVAPSEGQAWVNGRQVGVENDQIRGEVGILTESPGLYEKLSAYQNLDIYGRLYGVPDVARRARIQELLTRLELWDRRDDVCGSFSKGMKQKLAIARALLHEPKVLFLDEPTSALDPEAAKVVRDFISELRTEGRTVFLCTHNLDEADRLADRIGIMHHKLLQVDTPANLRLSLFGRQVAVKLKPSAAAYLSLVKGLSFVKEASANDGSLLVNLEKPEEQNPILVKTLVEAGAQVQYVTEIKHSLEEVYFSLIREEQP
jgi:ABC-2 type transport system ATP-binding protein